MRIISYLSWYKITTPYYALKRWYRFQRQIYAVPREARPMFWKLQAELTLAKAEMTYKLGSELYGPWIGDDKAFDGLAAIVDDGVNVQTYKKLKKGRLPRDM